MAQYRGVDCSMTYNGSAVGEGQGWRIRSAVDVLDTTKFGTAGYKTFIGGLVEWDGTMNMNLDLGDAQQLLLAQKLSGASPSSAAVAATFVVLTSAKQLSGTIVVTQAEITAQVAGLVTFAITFKGSGQLTATWS
jgi:predicted secreted protein